MARRKSTDPTQEPIQDAAGTASAGDPATDDTEGHSIGLLLGMMALDEANKASDRDRARARNATDVPPLTKSWPNLRAQAAASAAAEATSESADEIASGPVVANGPLQAPSGS